MTPETFGGGERRQNMIDLTIDIGVLKNNVTILTEISKKYDTTIEKLKDILNETMRLVAAHSEKHEAHTEALEHYKRNTNQAISEVKKEVETLKKYLWMAIGGAAVIMTVVEFYFKAH